MRDYGSFAIGKSRPGNPSNQANHKTTVWDFDGVGWIYDLPEGTEYEVFANWVDEVFDDDLSWIYFAA